MAHKVSYFAGMFLLLLSELSAFQRSALFDAMENIKLDGSVLRSRTSPDSLTCAHWCLSEPLCTSFNYQGSSGEQGLCELNHASQNDEERLRREAGWLHGGLKSKTEKKKKKPKGPCKTWQTTEDGCCVFPFTYRGKPRYSCVYDGMLWCATTDNYDVDQERGVCQEYNFTFTTLGASGAIGPSDTSGYQGTTLEGKVQLEGHGIQIWTVPIDGNFSIEVKGASGGIGKDKADGHSWRTGGLGARIQGEFYFIRGTELKILVGQVGKTGKVGRPLPGGGGGGSFVTGRDNKPLIIAGGGGGGGPPGDGYSAGDPGQVGRNGSQNGGGGGGGGRVVEESAPSASLEAGAGGGVRGDGKGGRLTNGGKSFKNGGEGGLGRMSGGNGGFGGGGAAGHYPGGGGGYSGGGVTKSSMSTTAGGGGSFNDGSSPVQTAGENQGDGSVRIKLIKPQSSP